MHADIWIVRNGSHYVLLHGHLRLHSTLSGEGAAFVKVRHEGIVKITRISGCLQVDTGKVLSPLCIQMSIPEAVGKNLPNV